MMITKKEQKLLDEASNKSIKAQNWLLQKEWNTFFTKILPYIEPILTNEIKENIFKIFHKNKWLISYQGRNIVYQLRYNFKILPKGIKFKKYNKWTPEKINRIKKEWDSGYPFDEIKQYCKDYNTYINQLQKLNNLSIAELFNMINNIDFKNKIIDCKEIPKYPLIKQIAYEIFISQKHERNEIQDKLEIIWKEKQDKLLKEKYKTLKFIKDNPNHELIPQLKFELETKYLIDINRYIKYIKENNNEVIDILKNEGVYSSIIYHPLENDHKIWK
jgi:hypothetical protein